MRKSVYILRQFCYSYLQLIEQIFKKNRACIKLLFSKGNTMEFTDIIYVKQDHIARVTINRPKVYNAFRNETVKELIAAFKDAWNDDEIGVVVLSGSGDKAFCTGGDLGTKDSAGYQGKAASEFLYNVGDLQNVIHSIPKPVIAAVNGYAIGGGHVLHVLCDLTIASSTSQFGQVGPKVGSVDPGWGTALLSRVIGEKRAREMWYLCRRYSAAEALQIGLINAVVEPDKLAEEVDIWCKELLERSPMALRLAKQSFNLDTDHIGGIGRLGFSALELFYNTEEAHEGLQAHQENRPTDYNRFRK
jgi:naphthoate synthase